MGDTLISMGLVGPVDIFRAIRDQGRDASPTSSSERRTAHLLSRAGRAAGRVPARSRPPALMLAGLETAKPGDAILNDHRDDLDRVLFAGGRRATISSPSSP